MNGNLILITFIKIDLMLLNILAVCVCVLSIHLIYQNSKQEDMFSRLINPSYSFHIKLSINSIKFIFINVISIRFPFICVSDLKYSKNIILFVSFNTNDRICFSIFFISPLLSVGHSSKSTKLWIYSYPLKCLNNSHISKSFLNLSDREHFSKKCSDVSTSLQRQ
jgi:hypothetical protein